LLGQYLGRNGRISIGRTLENTSFYMGNKQYSKDVLKYSQLKIMSGIKY